VQIINAGKLVFESSMDDLLQQQETGYFEVMFARPPSLEVLQSLDYVNSVRSSGFATFILRTQNASGEKITKDAVSNDWGLLKLIPTQRSLEQVFVELTHGDSSNEEAA
jgi:ABC-type multidrug transport system ATPase subunit